MSSYIKSKLIMYSDDVNVFNCLLNLLADCGKTFTQSGTLKRHVRSVHRGKKFKSI